jgi:hypothetical protein
MVAEEVGVKDAEEPDEEQVDDADATEDDEMEPRGLGGCTTIANTP